MCVIPPCFGRIAAYNVDVDAVFRECIDSVRHLIAHPNSNENYTDWQMAMLAKAIGTYVYWNHKNVSPLLANLITALADFVEAHKDIAVRTTVAPYLLYLCQYSKTKEYAGSIQIQAVIDAVRWRFVYTRCKYDRWKPPTWTHEPDNQTLVMKVCFPDSKEPVFTYYTPGMLGVEKTPWERPFWWHEMQDNATSPGDTDLYGKCAFSINLTDSERWLKSSPTS